MNLQPYFKELWDELNNIEDRLKSGKDDPELAAKRKEEIEGKLTKLRAMASKQKNTYVIKTNQGYLTANSKFTDNIHHAYTYDGDEAVDKAKKLKGWLEELPDCGFIK